MNKKCSKCGEVKPSTLFNKDKSKKDKFCWVPYEDIETLKDVEKLDK